MFHLRVEADRFETKIGQESIVHVADMQSGERVEVKILRLESMTAPFRKGGWEGARFGYFRALMTRFPE